MCQYIDPLTGSPITEAIFQVAEPFFEDRAAIRIDGLFGFIDPSGAIVIEPQFVEISRFRNGLAEVSNGVSVSLIDEDGDIIINTDFRRAIPISSTVIMAFIDNKEEAARRENAERHIVPALWREPRYENVFVFSEATLFSLDTGRISTPPVRAMKLIPSVTGTFWLQIAEPGDGWNLYDWGLMNERGEWIIDPGIMDVKPLPNGFSLIFNPPQNVERNGHDSSFGWELARNQSGWEAVVDANGNLVGGSYFENVDFTEDMKPLIWKDQQWFEVDLQGILNPFDGEPVARFRRNEKNTPPLVMTVDHSHVDDNLACAEGVRLFNNLGRRPDSLASALEIRWGLLDQHGVTIVPALHRYITCPQHGVALVPDVERSAWCPVGPVRQTMTPSTCQTGLWDGWIREMSWRETLHPDPFESEVLWRQRQLLWSQFPDVVDQPGWRSRSLCKIMLWQIPHLARSAPLHPSSECSKSKATFLRHRFDG